tara:strand:+ start:2201 stop:2845 length:645 start_codon:yes stop_codon:yes gene_type:complete
MIRTKEIPTNTKTLKVEARIWNTLKNLKKENETFNDVIKELLNERTKAAGNKNIKAIKYHRKIAFIKASYQYNLTTNSTIGLEFEYNDVKTQQTDFTLDLKIKKVFFGKKIYNSSLFFGVPAYQKHLSPVYLNLYLQCLAFALTKEFRVSFETSSFLGFEDITRWRKVYYDYGLSEDSFIEDIEEPLRLSGEEKLTEKKEKQIKNSPAGSIWGI